VIPHALVLRELAHAGLTDLRVVTSMHERKALMAELSDGFVALPGGLGTFEEIFEIVTWAQLGLHGKPCGVINVRGYWDALLRLFSRGPGFVRPELRLLTDGPRGRSRTASRPGGRRRFPRLARPNGLTSQPSS
jgi:predicted Rossmann-fold nucleotide-binding protein